MKRRKGELSFLVLAVLGAGLLVSCAGGLPPSLEREIGDENARIADSELGLQQAQEHLQQDLAQAPDLFASAAEPAQWTADLGAAQVKLTSAKADAQELARIAHQRGRDVEGRVRRLLREEEGLRQAAETLTKTTQASAAHWLTFRSNLSGSLDGMNREYQAIRAVDFAPAAKKVAQAEKDWPGKASDLDHRLTALRAIPQKAESEWTSTAEARQTAAAGKASGKQIATLIETDDLLAQQAKAAAAAPAEMTVLCAQLYDTWEKILTDLDESHYGGDSLYRERLKTVRTHYIDIAAKKTETNSEEHWSTISEPAFHAVEKDIGMAIAHKDAGHFDSEAQTVPQPPGYSYMAPPELGSNQYGYWTHDYSGHSVWTWLPEYLILRELLWNHDYHAIPVSDYSAYRMAQRSGASYYGQQTPASPPKYGSSGTFTQTHYAGSRYMQSGGFKGSAYASRGSGSGFGAASSEERSRGGWASEDHSAGKRFGRQPGSAPSGQRFGRPRGGGFRPSGRGFGRRR